MSRKLGGIFALVLAALTAGCGGQIVSRLAPGMVSESNINNEAIKAYEQVIAEATLSDDARLVAMVKRVGQRIAQASGENFDWQIELIESNEMNAWCMPGGKMAVYTGILPVLQTEGALAAVLGHEVAHATRRHGMRGYAEAVENQIAGVVIGAAAALAGEALCESDVCKQVAQLGGAAGAVGLAFFQRKFSRDDEIDADKFGQVYMAQAGYDPAEAINVWKRMEAATGGSSGPEFMSTHPSSSNRQKNLQDWLSETEVLYANAERKFGIGERLF